MDLICTIRLRDTRCRFIFVSLYAPGLSGEACLLEKLEVYRGGFGQLCRQGVKDMVGVPAKSVPYGSGFTSWISVFSHFDFTVHPHLLLDKKQFPGGKVAQKVISCFEYIWTEEV